MSERERKMVILPIIEQALKESSTPEEFTQVRSDEPLNFMVMEKIDKHAVYVTDGIHTILALWQYKRQSIVFHPLNRLSTPYYTYEAKTYMYLNFTEETAPLQKEMIHPYSPHFYFKDDYEKYLKVRETLQLKPPIDFLQIKNWSLGLVNISATGYYGPVIVIEKVNKKNCFKLPLPKTLNCILYERNVQLKLEAYRLMDLRKILAPKLPANQHVCLFYYLRHQRRSNNSADKKTVLLSMDEDGRILSCNYDQPKSYVLIGNVKGTCSFVKPVKKEVNQEKINQMNLQQMNFLFNGLKISDQPESKKKDNNRMEVWSDSEDSRSSREDRPEAILNDSMEEEDSDHGDDPLRNLYTKMLNKK